MLEKLHIAPECDGFLFLAETVRNPPVLAPHRHVELELNLVAAGHVRYVVEGRSYHFPTGSLLWLFPNQTHQLVDRSADAAYYVAVFRPRLVRQACRTRRYAPLRRQDAPVSGVLHTPLPADRFESLRNFLADLTRHGLDPDLLNREAGFGLTPGFEYRHGDPDGLNAGLRHLLLHAWRLQQPDSGHDTRAPMHPAIRRALELMNQPGGPASLPELAAACGIGDSTLSRLFRRELGIPLNHYRNSVRLARFMSLVHRPGTHTLLECVHQAGFGSYAQFYRVFKQAYGDNPRAVLGGRGLSA